MTAAVTWMILALVLIKPPDQYSIAPVLYDDGKPMIFSDLSKCMAQVHLENKAVGTHAFCVPSDLAEPPRAH